MKILLVEPAKAPLTIGGEDAFVFESLALEYIGAGVATRHDVRILDLRLEQDLGSTLRDFCPDVVGITSYTVHVNQVRSLSRQVKAWNERALTVVGGHHATVAPHDFITPFIDAIVTGEGVFAFQEIIARFEREERLEGIPGVAVVRNGQLVQNDLTLDVDLDALPFPDRSLTAKYRKHYYSEWMKPLASIRTSKGCSYRCNFCALWKTSGGCYLTRSPERVVQELATIDEEYVFFADDESLLDTRRMKTLARLILESGIQKRYFLYGRSDTIAREPELLKMWRDVGLERVFVGLEFFRDEDLEYIGKGSTIDDNERAVQVLHDLGIEIYASFILRPEFTKPDFAALRQYCRDLQLSFASFAVLTPLPGTDLYEDVRDQMITHNPEYYDFIHTLLPPTLPLKEFYEEYYQLLVHAVAPSKKLSFMKRYATRDILPTLVKGLRLYHRIRKAHRDYEQAHDGVPLHS